MFTVNDKHLGKLIGKGNEHLVYDKNTKYVYKVFTLSKTKNIFTLIKIIRLYLDSRNTISYLLPCKFIGVTFWNGYILPIFKQKKVTPLKDDIELPHEYEDVRRENFGIYEGKIVAIDIYKYRIRL